MNTIPTQAKWLLIFGALNAALAVALDAAEAHVLKTQLIANDPTHLFKLALQYHQLHAVGLMIIGLTIARFPGIRCLVGAGWLLLAGIVLFSGDLYLRSITGGHGVYMAIPIGGALFIFGWLLFAIGVLRLPTTSK
ncbi:Uncharacterized membrane protein YgdD, TMEM256/DUF423 family [Gammaproteobacteria bacterium]